MTLNGLRDFRSDERQPLVSGAVHCNPPRHHFLAHIRRRDQQQRLPSPKISTKGPLLNVIIASVKAMDDPSARMIDNYRPVVHQTVSILMSLLYPWRKRVGEGMNLDHAGQDRSNLRMKVWIADRIVVLTCGMLAQHMPMFWCERDAAAIMSMLRRCHTRSGQDHGGGS